MPNESYDIFARHCSDAASQEHWVGSNIQQWWDYVACRLEQPHIVSMLPDNKIKRTELKQFCSADSSASDIECAAAVMAWGGKNRIHGVTLFNRFSEIQPIIKDMRNAKITRFDAYERFDYIWKKPKNLGMGAAYFTKLIFFCEPSHKGYIMDQWTSKSVNLLTKQKLVYMTNGNPNKENTVDNYVRFCECLENLASQLKTSGENIEIAMFSKGGRNKWPWRQYVVSKTL